MSRQEALRNLVANVGFEVIPFNSAVEQTVQHVATDVPLTVTMAAAKGVDRSIEVAVHLRDHGFDVAPHLSARLFRDDAHVAEVVDRLSRAGVDRAFVVAGDAHEPVGAFADALALLEAIARTGHPFREVGVGGYPEGHPDFGEDLATSALVAKSPYADRIITQMCFDPTVTTAWATRLRGAGIDLRVHAGMPGPVNRQKLVRVSGSLGLGASARFLQKQRGLWRFLVPGGYRPTRLLKGLAAAQPEDGRVVDGIHLFTFNELAGAEAWRLAMRREVGLD